MTDEERARLAELASKATPGPWSDRDDPGANCPECGEALPLEGGVVFGATGGAVAIIDAGDFAPADRAFIAAARDAVPALLAEVERLQDGWNHAEAVAYGIEHHACKLNVAAPSELVCVRCRAERAERERDELAAALRKHGRKTHMRCGDCLSVMETCYCGGGCQCSCNANAIPHAPGCLLATLAKIGSTT